MYFHAILLMCVMLCVCGTRYPNEIEDTPVVLCEPAQVVIKIKTTSANPSLIYVDDFAEDPECSTRNRNSIDVKHGKCGMTSERTEEPLGAVQRLCISVQLHPLFVTQADRSYCVQCVYVEQHILNDFQQSIDVSEMMATELEPQFDFHTVPKCTYSIRKGSQTGPPAHYAAIGDSVFHVWQCDGHNLGILVQNCYVEDGNGNRIMIIDNNGCGVDGYVMETPQYNDDLNTAFQETHVFKFAQKMVTRFACQIRICVRGEDCNQLSPPRACPSLDDRTAAVESDDDEDETSTEVQPGSFLALSSKPKSVSARNASGNATIDTVYYGEDSRTRRETLLPPPSLRRSAQGYPEMEVVGEIRVLESADDVQYFERVLSEGDSSCISGLVYTTLVTALVMVSLILLALSLWLLVKNSHYRKRIVHFAN